ncbi:MAG: co-chaperone GroES [Deltaproteobacteria bacterium HGW-Deltaproteobacteria-14]|nr:MAG: co-chaperone GroES [Deltaproteobacteria bacterium HGW-Deltaproteobacteria-14]
MRRRDVNIQPLNDFVLVRPLEAELKTASGLYVPDTARETPSMGVVLAVPSGGAQGLALGERVVYRANAGEEVRSNGEKLLLVQATELLAKYVDADAI